MSILAKCSGGGLSFLSRYAHFNRVNVFSEFVGVHFIGLYILHRKNKLITSISIFNVFNKK